MVSGKFRSRSMRAVKVVLPKGKTIVRFTPRRPKKAHCSRCGKPLTTVLSDRPLKVRKVAKSQRRPQRAFGGVMCPSCSRQTIVEMVTK